MPIEILLVKKEISAAGNGECQDILNHLHNDIDMPIAYIVVDR